MGIMVRSIFFAFCASDLGWRKDLHEVKDQNFLGPEEFIEEVQGGRQERVSRVYKISLEDIVGEWDRMTGRWF